MQNDWFLNEIIPLWSISKGTGCRIYVLDSGKPCHRDLSTQVKDVLKTKDDLNGHSTHICGIIHQISPNCEIVPIKITDVTPDMQLIQHALEEIVKLAEPSRRDIVNLSLSYSKYSKKIHNLIKKLYKLDIPVICAAGNNDGKDSWYPAKYKETISVASYGKEFRISKFSSCDPTTSFYAPGEEIWSTWICNEYHIMSGTSQAAPYITAVIALLLTSSGKTANIPTIVSHLSENSFGNVSGKRIISPKAVLNNPVVAVDNGKRAWYSLFIDLFKKG